MRGLTHIVIGVGMTSLVLGTVNPVCLFAGGVASLLPDIDKSNSSFGQVLPWVSRWFERRFPHRSCTHSLVASGVLAAITYPIATLGYLPWNTVHSINVGFFSGYMADSFSKAGIELFWPSPARFVCPGNRKLRLATGSPVENGLLVMLVALMVFILTINLHGGMRTQFNRFTGTPDGVERVYKEKGASHLIVAHIKGYRMSDARALQGDFWIVEPHGKDFIVQARTGEIYKAGIEPDAQLQTDSITADAGPPASIQLNALSLDNDEIYSKLRRFNQPDTLVFVSGELKLDNPIDLHIVPDSRQFTTMRKSGDTITLDDAPLKAVKKQLGEEFGTGELSIRSIHVQP